jgi:hypothetical protein
VAAYVKVNKNRPRFVRLVLTGVRVANFFKIADFDLVFLHNTLSVCLLVCFVIILCLSCLSVSKKIYRLKEDQAFSLSLELGRREKVVRHPSADFLPQPPKEGVVRFL